jgi:Na+/proline symporter
MKPELVIALLLGYFVVLYLASRLTARKSDNASFYLAGRKSPWYIIAFGMIGSSLSGVTFISVPGWVVNSNFSYMQMVLGYVVGYFVIAYVLLPIYYRLNVTSIYAYLEHRFGLSAYKTGAVLFIISRTIGSAFRLFIVGTVLQVAVFDYFQVPFFVTVILTILLIWLYTNKGGIGTIIWTDVLQTILLLAAVVLTVIEIGQSLELGFSDAVKSIFQNPHSQIFYFDDWRADTFFFKHFFSGMFITIVMTGLDQDMMQKNLSCKNLKEAQRNVVSYGIAFVPINLLFMSLGVLLVMFAQQNQIEIPTRTDELYPLIAFGGYLSPIVAVAFIIGLIAAAYSSADSALTALTTSFTVDILGFNHEKLDTPRAVRIRKWVHLGISGLMVLVIVAFRAISDQSVISAIFRVAGYTYGPLLGMFAFGIFTKHKVRPTMIPILGILSPLICYGLQVNAEKIFSGYKMGYELLIINGALTYVGLYFSKIGKQFHN